MELRCPGTLFGVVDVEAKTIEMKCKRRQCGHRAGSVVVLHTFALDSGRLLGTRKFRDPRKGVTDVATG